MKSFRTREALEIGWEITKKHLGLFIGTLFLICVIAFGFMFITHNLRVEGYAVSPFVIDLMSFIVMIFLNIGFIKIILLLLGGEKATFKDLFSQEYLFSRYTIGYMLYRLIIFGGILLFIVPGIIWSIKFSFYGYLIIDKEMHPIDALRRSAHITANAKWGLFGFIATIILVNFLGVLAFGVGLFLTIPITALAMAHVYRTLLSQTEITLVTNKQLEQKV